MIILDTNVLIEAQQGPYDFDMCPGFWDLLKEQFTGRRLASIDWVHRELSAKEDQLKEWADEMADLGFFHESDPSEVQKAYQQVVSWVGGERRFKEPAKQRFMAKADGWLIAFAIVHRCRIATNEVYNPSTSAHVKIPVVSRQFGIECLKTRELVKELGGRFVLG